MSKGQSNPLRRGAKWLLIGALEVVGLAACGDSETNPVVIPEPFDEALPAAQVSADYADAGDTILVSFDLGELARDGERSLWATIEWDDGSFELLRAESLDAQMGTADVVAPGVLAVRLDRRDDLERPVLILEFRARHDTETDKFTIRDVRSASEREGERNDDVA